MSTIELTIYVGEDWQELLIADLLDIDFEAFWQEEGYLKAYIPAPRWDDTKREQLEQWLAQRGIYSPIEERVVEKQNWNRQWEETIQPVAVGPFLIKPTWSAVRPEHAGLIVLEIDPKMSFGTGYHESTRLALRFLPGLVHGGERVLDAGTGTGVLAIAALKLGALSAVAFDIDEWAQVNAVENFLLNDVSESVSFRCGSLEVVPEDDFDIVLANINRNVLIELLPGFSEKMHTGSRLVLSGLLTEQDRDIMLETAAAEDFIIMRESTEGEWWAGDFRYDPPK